MRRNFIESSYQSTNIGSDKKIFTREKHYDISKDGQPRKIYSKNANEGDFGVNSDVKTRSS